MSLYMLEIEMILLFGFVRPPSIPNNDNHMAISIITNKNVIVNEGDIFNLCNVWINYDSHYQGQEAWARKEAMIPIKTSSSKYIVVV